MNKETEEVEKGTEEYKPVYHYDYDETDEEVNPCVGCGLNGE